MKNFKSAIAVLAATALFVSCNTSTTNQDGDPQDSTAVSDSVGTLAVNPLDHAKEFLGATLKIAEMTAEKVGSDSAKITVKYDIRSEEHTSELQSREKLVCRTSLDGDVGRRHLHAFPTRRSSDLVDDEPRRGPTRLYCG